MVCGIRGYQAERGHMNGEDVEFGDIANGVCLSAGLTGRVGVAVGSQLRFNYSRGGPGR